MSRDHGRKPAAQVLKGLRVAALSRPLPYHEQETLARVASVGQQNNGSQPPEASGGHAHGNHASTVGPAVQVLVEDADVEARVAAALAEAEQAGYQQGLARGRQEAQQELAREREMLLAQARTQEAERQAATESALESVRQALRQLEGEQQQLRERIAAQSAGLAFEALCRMVGRTTAAKDTLLPLIQSALDRWSGAQRPALRLSPQDRDALKSALAPEHWQDLEQRVEVLADPAVAPMGALIEDADGGFDIGVETQLRALGEAWSRALQTPRGAS